MTGETEDAVRQIRQRCKGLTSLVGRYEASVRLHVMPLETRGRFSFKSPDKYRSESVTNGARIVSVRNGNRVERRLPSRKEIWKYDLGDLPLALPLNYGVADHRDPFFAVDETGLVYEGIAEMEGARTLTFSGDMRSWAQQGLLDTRKGFSISFQPRVALIRMQLSIASETGLLRRMIATDAAGTVVLQADYFTEGINVDLEDSLFAMEESTAAYQTIDITDVMLSAMNPDAADAPPSLN